MQVIAANHPLRSDLAPVSAREGMTLTDILEQAQPDPVLRAHAHIFVGDVRVPRERWALVRPKSSSIVTIRVVPQGGGGGGSKNPLRTILTIAVVAAAAAVTSGAALGGLASAVPGGAAVLGAAVAVGGNLLVNAIAPIRGPSLDGRSGTSKRDSATLSIEGARNTAKPFGVVPVVLGKHRHVPPLAAQSYTEVLGDDQYLRMLVVWGYGPLQITNLRIDDTPLSSFEGVRVETRQGRSGDAPLTLFPSQVVQQDLGIRLRQDEGWQVRTSGSNADELSVDIAFPQGLTKFSDAGDRAPRRVGVQIAYRQVGEIDWKIPSFSDATTPSSWFSISSTGNREISFTHKRTSAIRHGFRWSVPRGQYEVQLRRVTSDTDDPQTSDTTVWSALRTITDDNPIQFDQPVAVTALSIKATDQLNGTVDQLTADVSSYVKSVWTGNEVITSNPAHLYRHVLQGAANARGLSDSRIDIDGLQDWAQHCNEEGFEFNMVRDFQASVWETLADIAAAGRASPSQRDGKWGVVVDKPQPYPVQHFTPRNSWGFEAEKTFPDPPDAFRIRFSSRESQYEQDERIVYADGYNASNAEVFESLDAPGITDPAHIWKFGRFHLAQAILRPERWTLNLDFEHLVARRGSWVKITHDVLLVGLASGRIKEVLTDVDGNATGFVSDELLSMEAGTTYGVSIRTVGDAAISRELVTVDGDNHIVDFAVPIPAASAPMTGDLFGFGESGKETVDALVLSIEPQSDLVARLVLIPYSPEVYDSDTGEIPAFDPGITPIESIPDAMVTGVRTGETVLTVGLGSTLTPHAAIALENPQYPGLVADAQIRPSGTGEPFVEASIARRNGTEIWVGEVNEGETYDFRVRWLDPARVVTGRWSYINAQIVSGSTNPPQELRGLTISAFGGSALLRWDQPPDIDVRIGGEIRFRHSQAENATVAQWNNSTSIGDSANGNSTTAVLPLKRGTYLARVYDSGGRPSTEIAAISTKQASVLAFANLDSVTESPLFPGTKSGVTAIDGSLWLSAVGQFDDIQDFDSLSALDSFGGIGTEGYYTFSGGFDFGALRRVRLTSVIDATAINVLDRIDERTDLIDTWEDFDGTLQAQADARVQVRHTDDDPLASPTWTVWNNLDSAEFEARAFQFRVQLTSRDPAYNMRVDELGVVAEELA
ncbi:host specificity factor TipJ family phage tail protein [Halomonas sp. 5021]|uniref:host specificity factor TipJ family phage tail protein n=1 Tax=Halomonas sp. 5021 TaxID=3082156 RepID=UPI002FC90C91